MSPSGPTHRHLRAVSDEPDEATAPTVALDDRPPPAPPPAWVGSDVADVRVLATAATPPVKPASAAVPAVDRGPVIPTWLRSREQRSDRARGWVATRASIAAFHTVRAPLYGAQLARPRRSLRGLGLVALWLGRIAVVADGRYDVKATRVNGDPVMARRMAKEVNREALWRLGFMTVALLIVAMIYRTTLGQHGAPVKAVALAVVLMALGAIGRAEGEPPIVARATDKAERISEGFILSALRDLGLAKLTAAIAEHGDQAVRWMMPPVLAGKGEARGYEAHFRLPPGVTVAEVMGKRSTLAANLGRRLDCVWVEPLEDGHPGEVALFVSHKPMAAAGVLEWTPPKVGNVFAPIWLGRDRRGRDVTIRLVTAEGTMCTLIGAMPGMGKTNVGRILAGNAALDVDCELHIINAKGGVDFDGLEPVCHSYFSDADVDSIIEDALASVVDLRKRVEGRSAILKALAKDPTMPTSTKVTEATARIGRGLHPVLLVIEEFQRLFNHPEHGKELRAEVEDLVRIGRALGVIVVLSTQKPSGNSLPTDLRDNLAIGLCGRVRTDRANDMVLGSGAYSSGYRATDFSSRDRGLFWLVGDAEEPTIVRAALAVDEPDDVLVEVGARAYELRLAAEKLTGMAAGAEPPPAKPTTSIVWDVERVMRGEERLWMETILEKIQDRDPERYRGWEPETVTKTLNGVIEGIGLEFDPPLVRGVKIRGTNRNGIRQGDFARLVWAMRGEVEA